MQAIRWPCDRLKGTRRSVSNGRKAGRETERFPARGSLLFCPRGKVALDRIGDITAP
jgi:hypothetical protein